MVRIAGVSIPESKNIEIALTYIYGVGRSRSQKILADTKIDSFKKAKDLTQDELGLLKNYIEKNYTIEGELRREVSSNIKRLKEIGTYRGTRHSKRLPLTGRTNSNSRPVRGNIRRPTGSGKPIVTNK